MTGWLRWTVASVTLLVGAIVIVVALGSPDGLQSVTSVGGLVTALIPLVLGLVMWARRPPSAAFTTIEQTDAAQRQLARQVLVQWRDEINVRQLDDPGPLAVRWRRTELDVVDRPHKRPRLSGRTDRVAELAAEFRGLARRRLVILGAPGTGKTTLALLLLRELLEHAEPGDPVPVLLSMSGWDPGAESLPAWLARRLAEDYPTLRATVFGQNAARSLVAQRKILPVLDGFDELPQQVRPAILARLNDTAGDPLVLTCRTTEYQAAVTGPGGDALTSAAVIEPAPLTPADAARYLASCLPPGSGDAWCHLLTSLRSAVDSPVTRALATPLALWLLRTVYVDTRTDPAGLNRFRTADAVVEHLLDHLVDALVSANSPHRRDNEHAFRPGNPTDTTRWLRFLANHLTAAGSRDLAWWQLHRTAPRGATVVTGLVAGLALALAVNATEWLRWGLVERLWLGPVHGLVFGIVVGCTRSLTIGHVIGLVFALDLLVVGVGSIVEDQTDPGTATGMAVFSIAFVAVLAWWARHTPADGPAYADLRLRGRLRPLARKIIGWGEHDLELRFLPGFAAGFLYGAVFGFFFRDSPGSVGALWSALVTGMVFGLVSGFASWLAIGVIAWAKTPITEEHPRTSTNTFRGDLRLVYVNSLAGGCAIGLAFGAQERIIGGPGLMTGLSYAVVGAVAIAFGVGPHQPSGRYLITVSLLWVHRRTPLRLLRFLDDAHRLGILRQVGARYQFRHAKLQDQLARRRSDR